jgi:hypothetical protein
MTPIIGANQNADPSAIFYFSNCSIKSFKDTLLRPNMS